MKKTIYTLAFVAAMVAMVACGNNASAPAEAAACCDSCTVSACDTCKADSTACATCPNKPAEEVAPVAAE